MEDHGRDVGFGKQDYSGGVTGQRLSTVIDAAEKADVAAEWQRKGLKDMLRGGPVPTTSTEVRITDPNTGGEKGSKLARFDLIPIRALWLLAEVYGRGARKYADRNWEKGYAWGLSIAALERHLNAWKGGESIDEETGAYHLAQVAWHAFTLLTFSLLGLGTDDRSAL